MDEEQVFEESALDADGEPIQAVEEGEIGESVNRSKYKCRGCGYQANVYWIGACPSCHRRYNPVSNRAAGTVMASSTDLIMKTALPRFSLGLKGVDHVLGGGPYPHSCVLLGGDPGAGKTTLCLQIGGEIATERHLVIFASGEDGEEQIGLYMARFGVNNPHFKAIGIENGGSNVDKIMERALAAGPKPRLLIIDSAQTVMFDDVEGDAGSPSQVGALANFINDFVKTKKIAVILIAQLDKSGFDFAGVAKLKYLVDALTVIRDLDDEVDEETAGLREFGILGGKTRLGPNKNTALFKMTEGGLEPVKEKKRRSRLHLLRDQDEDEN